MKEASVLRHGPLRFLKENFPQRSPKQDRSSRRDNNPRKSWNKLIKEHMTYPETLTTLLNATLTEVFTTIEGKQFVQYPLRMRSPSNTRTSKKYCLFR